MESSENGRGPSKKSTSSEEQQPSSNRDAPPPPRDAPPSPRDAPPPQQDTPPPPRDAPPPPPPPPQQGTPAPPRDEPPAEHPPVAPPSHMTYYSSPIGHPGGYGGQPYPPGPGYPPYPNEYPPHHQPYNYAPPPPYNYGPTQTYTPSTNGGGFIKGFVLCSCVMFTAAFVTTIVLALVLHPELPIYKVVSLSVENFNTTTALTGTWNTVITVENPNEKLKGTFSDFKVDLLYKRDEVAGGYAPGFELGKNEKKQIEVKASSNVANVDRDGIAKERGSGSVTFAVRISSMTAFESSSMSTRGKLVMATCRGLKVVFQNNSSGSGRLDNGGKPIDCQLYM